MKRKQLLHSFVDTRGLGLEIGPGFNPLLPKREGYRVETLDHASRADLVAKYQNAPGVDVSRIEEVDHISTGGSVFEAIGQPGRYRYIVASHVIEHTPNLLGFLQDCERLLDPEGVLVLFVPDKRSSFDVLRPLTSTGDVLQAHLEGRTRHTAGRVFDEMAYNVLRGGALSWHANNRDPLAFFGQLNNAKALFEHVQRSSEYIDIHAWQFTPSSFRLITNDLFETGCLAVREHAFETEGLSGEFAVALARQGGGPGVGRLELAERALAEHAAIQLSEGAVQAARPA